MKSNNEQPDKGLSPANEAAVDAVDAPASSGKAAADDDDEPKELPRTNPALINTREVFRTGRLIKDGGEAVPFDATNLPASARGYERLTVEYPYNSDLQKGELRTIMNAARAGYYGTNFFETKDTKRQSHPKTTVYFIEHRQLEKLLTYLTGRVKKA